MRQRKLSHVYRKVTAMIYRCWLLMPLLLYYLLLVWPECTFSFTYCKGMHRPAWLTYPLNLWLTESHQLWLFRMSLSDMLWAKIEGWSQLVPQVTKMQPFWKNRPCWRIRGYWAFHGSDYIRRWQIHILRPCTSNETTCYCLVSVVRPICLLQNDISALSSTSPL